MSVLFDETARVLVQGITGREGRARTGLMKNSGVNIVAGVTPGRQGESVLGIPVYDTVSEAVEARGKPDATVVFVPAPMVKNAVIEAFSAGIGLAVIVPDKVPLYDAMAIRREAELRGARFTGPNTLGILSPGRGVLGMIGGSASSVKEWFMPGPAGITSRSGGLTTSTAYYLNREGVGISTIVHVGGDAVVGMPHPEVVRLFQKDPETEVIVMLGEIGGVQEEEVAALMLSGEVTKPLVAYIGGKGAKEGTQFSHAGAIIEGSKGTHSGKVEILKKAGAVVVDEITLIPSAVLKILKERGIPNVRK